MISIGFLGIYRQVGLNLTVPNGTKTIDATGKLVMPGENEEQLISFIRKGF